MSRIRLVIYMLVLAISLAITQTAYAKINYYLPKKDTTIISGAADSSLNGGNYLYVGNDSQSGWGIQRTLLNYSLDSLMGKHIYKARIRLAYRPGVSDKTDAQRIAVHNVTNKAWTTSNTDTWNSINASGSFFDLSAAASTEVGGTQNQYVYFDVTSLVKSWLAGTTPNYGVLVKAENEQSINEKVFRSGNYPDANYSRPLLEITTDSSKPVTYARNTSAKFRKRGRKKYAIADLKWKVTDTYSDDTADVSLKIEKRVISRPHKKRKEKYLKKYESYKAKYKKTINKRLRKRYLKAAKKYFKAYRKTSQYKYIKAGSTNYGWTAIGEWRLYKFKAKEKGVYRFLVFATDKGGNKQNNVAEGLVQIK